MMENFRFDPLNIIGILIPMFQYLVIFVFNILIIIISSMGYKETKSKGWLLLMVYGLINLLLNIPNVFYALGARFIPIATFGRFMYGFSIVTTLLRIGAGVALIAGLVFLVKEHRSLLKEK